MLNADLLVRKIDLQFTSSFTFESHLDLGVNVNKYIQT